MKNKYNLGARFSPHSEEKNKLQGRKLLPFTASLIEEGLKLEMVELLHLKYIRSLFCDVFSL